MIYVIGSGPAGVSCAMALLQQGAKVTLLEPGLELEPERSAKLVKLQTTSHDNWQPADMAFLKEGTSAGVDGIPLKYAYGSDFPYRDPGVDWQLDMVGLQTRPSFARGGLSNVWGAAILPYRSPDIRDWPIGEQDLESHYRAVFQFMPLAGRRDLLEQLFPLHSEQLQALNLSRQTVEFLEDLDSSSEELESAGILHGASRLAVTAQPSRALPGCCYCGQCMYGCPYGLIYNSSLTLDVLSQHPNFKYKNNVVVDRLMESGEEVTLFAHDLGSRSRVEFKGSRVFLACGVLATTKILLESLEAFDQRLILQDTTYFLMPLLRFLATPGVSREGLHTLAQAFLEIVDPQIYDRTIHLQIYSYNDLYSAALKKLFGPASRLLAIPSKMLLERMLLVQGYLPSGASPSIGVVLRRGPESGCNTLCLTPIPNERTAPVLEKVVQKLKSNRSLLRAFPLSFMIRQGQPGRSFHSGGTFPMQTSPGRFQSDIYGRPYGFNRVHAVDATVFPSIPATTITLSVMANAHRIGSAIREY